MTKQFIRSTSFAAFGVLSLLVVAGCGRSQQPVSMAPPVQAPPPAQTAEGSAGVYNWKDVPANQDIPVTRGVFDQGGYQIYAASGETIVVPFENQNMYVMKFGKATNGQMYFRQDGATPTLYVPDGAFLENASAQGAKWYPFPQNYAYERPVYIGIAPSWTQFVGMGWYPNMAYYGGYWGYSPWHMGYAYAPMVGLNFNIGGRPYYGWNSYQSYYRSNPSRAVRFRSVYNYSSARSSSPSSFGRSRNNFGTSSGSGSFGRRTSGSTGSFGRSSSGGSFGSSSSRPSGSFGSGFGSSSRRSGGSFGSSGSSGFGGSFGRSSGSSFGRPSSGGSSFGRPSTSSGGGFFGRSSGGGSFGGGGGSFGRGRSSFGGGRRR